MTLSESRHFETECDHLIQLAFLAGWTSADEAHLVRLPEVIGNWANAQRVTLLITHQDPHRVRKFSFPAVVDEGPGVEAPAFLQSPAFEFERPLARDFAMSLKIYAEAPLSFSQDAALQRVLSMVHASLDTLLASQHERRLLGDRIASLSDREWQVCQVLESSESEKLIADQFVFSRRTLHTYVRNIYRKMMVSSRLAVIEKLRQARNEYRRRSLDRILRAGDPALGARNRTSETFQTV